MELKNLSIRGRVALSALCLEELLKNNSSEYNTDEGWQFILKSIWDYTNTPPGSWHYKMAEIIPFSIEEDVSFEEKGIEYLDSDTYFLIREAYRNTCGDIKKVINLIFEIGTLDLYSSISDNSPRTLSMLEEILSITQRNGLLIPSVDRFRDYDISSNHGWGNSFNRSEIINEDDLPKGSINEL